MKGDRVCLNGELIRCADTAVGLDRLLACNFVYQKIHTIAHAPLHLSTHIELADMSYNIMYGRQSGLSADIITAEIKHLLSDNRYPVGSNLITLYLIPPQDSDTHPSRLLSCEKQLLYKGYTLWHTPATAISVPYEYPFPHYQTAVSLAAHTYAKAYAVAKNADIALVSNYNGCIISAGEYPFFAVSRNNIYTSPIETGLADSVERRLGISACERAGWTVYEHEIEKGRLKEFEEMFFVTPQGIVSIGEFEGRLYPNSAAKIISEAMVRMTDVKL